MSQIRSGRKTRVWPLACLVILAMGLVGCDFGVPAAMPTPTNTFTPPTVAATITSQTGLPTEESTATQLPQLVTSTAKPGRSPEATVTQESVPPATATGGVPTPAATANLGDYQWKHVGLAGTPVTDLGIAGQGANLVVAAGPSGVWHSTYDYTNWARYNVNLTSQGRTSEVAVGSRGMIYVTNHTGCASGAPTSQFRTINGGNTWQAISDEIIHVAVSSPLIAYGATCNGVIKTTDSGATWSALAGSSVANFDVHAIAASPDGEQVYASYASEGGSGRIMNSSGGGATWKDVTPTNAPDNDFRAALNLFFVPGSEGRPEDGGLYMANEQGLWFLPLESTEWKLTHEQTLQDSQPGRAYYVTALYVDTEYSEEYDKPGPVIYTARIAQGAEAQAGLGVFRSIDGGGTWQSVGAGLPAIMVDSLVLAPQSPGASANKAETLIAATSDGIWALPMPPPFR